MKFVVVNCSIKYKERVIHIINNRKKEIFEFFGKELEELPFDIYIYDNVQNLIEGLKDRGYGDVPNYICACHKDEDNSLNFFEPKEDSLCNEWSKEEYDNVIFHELVHGIQFSLFGNNYEWFNEGVAKHLDGTYKKGIKYLLDDYINNSDTPPQYEIENEFGMHDYDSYDYAYIMASYLLENLGKEGFIELVQDKNKIHKMKSNLLFDSINYYNNKYEIINTKKRRQ